MKYTKKIPGTDKELSNTLINEGWRKIKEPKTLAMAILCSIPFIIINGLISIGVTLPFYNFLKHISYNGSITINIDLKNIGCFIILIVLHEFIHASIIPNIIKSQNVYWGITIFGGFVATTEKISKIRFIFISLAPFILLSIILPIILGAFNLLNNFIVLLIFINAMGSSVDLLNAILIMVQVPKDSYIINNGFETYFK